MFAKFFTKINGFADHHQFVFAIIVASCIIIASWAIEQILDRYIFPQKKLAGYIGAIFFALATLWMVKHFVLHVI